MNRFKEAGKKASKETNKELAISDEEFINKLVNEENTSNFLDENANEVYLSSRTMQTTAFTPVEVIEFRYPDGTICVAPGRVPMDWAFLGVFIATFFVLGWILGSREK